jgi:hypothetical protein
LADLSSEMNARFADLEKIMDAHFTSISIDQRLDRIEDRLDVIKTT